MNYKGGFKCKNRHNKTQKYITTTSVKALKSRALSANLAILSLLAWLFLAFGAVLCFFSDLLFKLKATINGEG